MINKGPNDLTAPCDKNEMDMLEGFVIWITNDLFIIGYIGYIRNITTI